MPTGGREGPFMHFLLDSIGEQGESFTELPEPPYQNSRWVPTPPPPPHPSQEIMSTVQYQGLHEGMGGGGGGGLIKRVIHISIIPFPVYTA